MAPPEMKLGGSAKGKRAKKLSVSEKIRGVFGQQ